MPASRAKGKRRGGKSPSGCLILILGALLVGLSVYFLGQSRKPSDEIVLLTWNVRGYPEKEAVSRRWFHDTLLRLGPGVACVQEIASQERVDAFLSGESLFTRAAFIDSTDSQDNAIFVQAKVGLRDLPDPEGFQHPPQAVYLYSRGFDATLVTVHLSWKNLEWREKEKQLLKDAVQEMRKIDPDVIVAGDFNTPENEIRDLADFLGLEVMAPLAQDGVGTTHAGNRYDYFLISKDLADEEALWSHIERFIGNDLDTARKVSDHLPVIARFRVDEKFRDRR